MPQRPDRVARQWRIPAAVPVVGAVLMCAALIVLVAVVGDDGDEPDASATTTSTTVPTTPSSTTTTEPPEPVPVDAVAAAPLAEDVPATYRITYEIVENGLARQETWTMRRPYESLVVAERDGELVSGSATSRTELWTYLADRDGWFDIQPELHRASFDQRPLGPLATMLELGLVEAGGTGEFAGRACDVYRTGPPLAEGVVAPPSPEQTTEFCVDGSGLVLHERWEIGGAVVSEKTATAVDLAPEIDDAMFDPAPQIEEAPELETLLATVAVAADEEIRQRLRTDVVLPDGYELDGVVFRGTTSESEAGSASEIVRFYSNGPDLIEVVEVTVNGPADLSGGGARPMEVERFDEVWIDLDFRASNIRARINDSSFLELRGAVPAQLLDILRTTTLR